MSPQTSSSNQISLNSVKGLKAFKFPVTSVSDKSNMVKYVKFDIPERSPLISVELILNLDRLEILPTLAISPEMFVLNTLKTDTGVLSNALMSPSMLV